MTFIREGTQKSELVVFRFDCVTIGTAKLLNFTSDFYYATHVSYEVCELKFVLHAQNLSLVFAIKAFIVISHNSCQYSDNKSFLMFIFHGSFACSKQT